MANELKKECGLGYYWCSTDMVCKPIQEDAPVNAVGGGQIAGVGIGTQGEPGVNPKKKKSVVPFKTFMRKTPNM
jgi:hypothetical protein